VILDERLEMGVITSLWKEYYEFILKRVLDR